MSTIIPANVSQCRERLAQLLAERDTLADGSPERHRNEAAIYRNGAEEWDAFARLEEMEGRPIRAAGLRDDARRMREEADKADMMALPMRELSAEGCDMLYTLAGHSGEKCHGYPGRVAHVCYASPTLWALWDAWNAKN
jgi:hypothetical protein